MTTLESERDMTRSEIADYLREFAAQLETARTVSDSVSYSDVEEDTRITFMIGNDSKTIDPPETVVFEVEAESDASLMGSQTQHEVDFQMSWQTEPSDEDEEEEIEIK